MQRWRVFSKRRSCAIKRLGVVSGDRAAGTSSDERRLTLDNLTRVSTDKVLENVQIVDRWVDMKKGLHYALAGMHRLPSGDRFMERITELDRSIKTDVEEAHRTSDKLAKAEHSDGIQKSGAAGDL